MIPDGKVPQEQSGDWPFLEKHRECICPTAISCVSSRCNISCQKLFTLAYARVGYGESFGRAMFAQFLKCGRNKNHLPLLVKDLCETISRITPEANGEKPNCFGCKTTRIGLEGILGSYERIHPEVNEQMLIEHSSNPSTMRPPKELDLVPIEELSEVDRAWIQLVEAGVLNEDDWGSIIKRSNDEF